MSKKTIMAAIALLLASGGYAGYTVIKQNDPDAYEASMHKVERVIDGDTLVLADGNRVRLLGIDAPERDECFFSESQKYLTELLTGKDIKLEKGLTAKDQYGRLLRWVILPSPAPGDDNILVNKEILRKGFALRESYEDEDVDDNRYRDALAGAESEGKSKKAGMWGECQVSDPKVEANKLREADDKPEDPNCTIKGNISEKGFGRNYFLSYCPNYIRIKIDKKKGEAYFCTEKEAEKAGFTKSESCANTF